MKSWLRQHRFAFNSAFSHMRRMPGNFLFNVIVMAIALSLPFAGLTVMENVRPISKQLSMEPEISMFLTMNTPRERAASLAQNIRSIVLANQLSATLEFVPREHALGALKNRTGLSDALTALGTNPLPDSYILRLSNIHNPSDALRMEAVAAQLKSLPGIEYVQIDSIWVKRLAALMNLLRLLLLMLALTLGIVVVAVVFNTIRLQVLTQQEEIEISKLVGATNSFIYRPFYYSGALLGLCAGSVALLAVAFLLNPLNAAVVQFANLYASQFKLSLLPWPGMMFLLAASAALGLTGALLSVRYHLSRLQ